jgi:hypothetical protein
VVKKKDTASGDGHLSYEVNYRIIMLLVFKWLMCTLWSARSRWVGRKKRKRRENIKYLTHRMQITSKTSSLDHDFFRAIGYIIKTPFLFFLAAFCFYVCARGRVRVITLVSVCMCVCVCAIISLRSTWAWQCFQGRKETWREHRVHFRRVYYDALKVPVYAETLCAHIGTTLPRLPSAAEVHDILFAEQFISLLLFFSVLLTYWFIPLQVNLMTVWY